MKKTRWFPSDVKPAHIGVYEVQNMFGPEHPPLFNYWTGKQWTGAAEHIEDAVMEDRPHMFAIQDRVWRGLMEKAA
jgi:hypothetical protein